MLKNQYLHNTNVYQLVLISSLFEKEKKPMLVSSWFFQEMFRSMFKVVRPPQFQV